MNKEINNYYTSILQEISALQSSAGEEGANKEQLFTQIALELLSEAGETENAMLAYDEKSLGTKAQHKINAYAISDNYDTVDLFISIFQYTEELQSINKSEIERACTRVTNFFRKATYNEYAKDIDESSAIFEFAHTLADYSELKNNLVRVNANIITNSSFKGEIPKNIEIGGYKIFIRVLDINYFYSISKNAQVPIKLDFEKNGISIPCLSATTKNTDYQGYVAILPGKELAELYEQFGSRLLEQNVRSFLQFTSKINKGIRTTIKDEPHMFLAYNNGIAATADEIILDESGHFIKEINNLQIVNGGQTTASIYQTWKKDKADISNVFVPMKISVIEKGQKFNEIVSNISRYSNTQNKVNNADFTANNPILIELEKVSRRSFSPITPTNNLQTIWFFERARGQYKNLRQKDGFTKSRQKQFDLKYPRKQMFTKTDLAKYVNAYNEVKEGKKTVIGPHVVVRGNEKNYAKYINSNAPEKITGIYFEDVIAKFILFKDAVKRYGVKPNAIGEMRNAVVPYAISLLSYLTDGQLDLEKIWKNQSLSIDISNTLYSLMCQLNEFIITESPSSHYIEWAKKEECWNKVKDHNWNFRKEDIKNDLATEAQLRKRHSKTEDINENELKRKYELSLLRSIPYPLWKKIEEWGKDTKLLDPVQQGFAGFDMANKIKFKRVISDNDRTKAMLIYEIVCEHNIELLAQADEIAQGTKISTISEEIKSNEYGITIELLEKMVQWDKTRHILKNWQWEVMNDIIMGKKTLNNRYVWGCQKNLEILKKAGFQSE